MLILNEKRKALMSAEENRKAGYDVAYDTNSDSDSELIIDIVALVLNENNLVDIDFSDVDLEKFVKWNEINVTTSNFSILQKFIEYTKEF